MTNEDWVKEAIANVRKAEAELVAVADFFKCYNPKFPIESTIRILENKLEDHRLLSLEKGSTK